MDRNTGNNRFSIDANRNGLRDATPAQPSQPPDGGQDLVEKFLADLDRSWQEQGSDIFQRIMIERPNLYFRALLKLALVQHRGLSKLSDLDRHRNRAEASLRLERPAAKR